MYNGLKIITVFLLLTTGCTVITEARSIRCYLQSINNYVEYKSRDIEKMMVSPYYNTSLHTLIFIHGFNASEDGVAITTIIPGAIKKGGRNVCLWNWIEESRAANLLGTAGSYTFAAIGTIRLIGQDMGRALAKVADKGMNLPSLYMYTHSLGAHLAGYAAMELKRLGAPAIGRIIGMDPAGPLFQIGLGRHLQSGDASYVTCVHCDPGRNGINASYCDTDIWLNEYRFFSPNEAEREQPGCLEVRGFCSHNYCVKVTTASFEEDFPISFGFNYWEWASSNGTATPRTLLGEKIDTSVRGNLYVGTRAEPNYSLGLDGLRPYYYSS